MGVLSGGFEDLSMETRFILLYLVDINWDLLGLLLYSGEMRVLFWADTIL